MQEIADILTKFEPITLEEMDSVRLLDRMDTKFVFNINHLLPVLETLAPYYSALEIANNKSSRYETLYFDTDDFLLYTLHHNGKLNRYKVRHRCYLDSGQHFFEIKFKTNKDRTVKDRIKRKEFQEIIQGKAESLLTEKTPYSADLLHPALWVYYSRITLVNKAGGERLTIDVNLAYKNKNKEVSFPRLVIAEVKQGKASRSPFTELMRGKKILPVSISKYCYGIINTQDNVKKNRFKPKIRTLNKIML
ncbi:MAG: polyphosphate polymerase domain-containing protein [Bacteroidia bacterium]|nr:polyphosphate polymerase domain-containing protein [Bacteroidia bacterium]